MKATLNKSTTQRVVVTGSGGRIQSQAPITLKNQVSEINSIEDIKDVAEVDVSSGATLVYNSVNDKYEVRKLTINDIGIGNIDGGEF